MLRTQKFSLPQASVVSPYSKRKIFPGVDVCCSLALIKISVYLILEDATRETEHRSAMHSAPSVEVCVTLSWYKISIWLSLEHWWFSG